ncbi:GntR family transcriptional regulator [Acrocarpospora sp. B8E8]|uniref:GntR family transcriptional regulator n=1 Tax=Acrocarpospora sp. B8E8 TaxID=3153572 RepID=UPI00325D248F
MAGAGVERRAGLTGSEDLGRPGRAAEIRHDSVIPIYVQVADVLAKEIVGEGIPPGSKLLSVKQLQREFGIAGMTAWRVHRELCERGLVHAVSGSGTFVGPASAVRGERARGSADVPGEAKPVRRGGAGVVYVRVAEVIAGRIEREELGPGERVPSEAALQREFGIAQMTARRVHRELCERGLAHTVSGGGGGTFVGRKGTPRPESEVPMFERIAGELAAEIRAGVIGPGERLPGARVLVAVRGVSLDTIRMALAVLRGEGWVVTVPCRGTFVADRSGWPKPREDGDGRAAGRGLEPDR